MQHHNLDQITFAQNPYAGECKDLRNYMDKDALRALVKEHFDVVQNRRLFLWSLLNEEGWGFINDKFRRTQKTSYSCYWGGRPYRERNLSPAF